MIKQISAISMLLFVLTGCVSQSTFDQSKKETNDSKSQIEKLTKENTELKKENDDLKSRIAMYMPKDSKSVSATKNFTPEQEYAANLLEIQDFHAAYYNSFTDGKIPGVEFKIKNKGNKTLSSIEVTVYFKDDQGKSIAEEKYQLLGSFEDYKELKPNYTWQMDKDQFKGAPTVPKEWKSGNAEAKITDVKFSD